ncbi:MAG: hypothetical protein ACK53T_04685 [Planctomycetota bacterium]
MSEILNTLTRAQREAVRVIVARAWRDGMEPTDVSPSDWTPNANGVAMRYAARALPDPVEVPADA